MEQHTAQEREHGKGYPPGTALSSLLFMILAVGSLGIVLFPLLQEGLYLSTDAPFHLARIESLFLALKEGVFPVKVHFAEAYTYGYGVGFFYPDCFLYFPAFLMLFGVPLERSYKIYAAAVTIMAWISMYAALELLQGRKNKWISACGAALYIMSFQYTGYLYLYQSVGSYTAMAFLPVCIGELLHILYQQYRKRDLIVLTNVMAGVLLSHVSTFVLLAVFLLVIFFLSFSEIMKHLVRLRDLFCCLLGGTLLTIGFWMPALEQILIQKYRFQTAQINPISDVTVSWREFPSVLGSGMLILVVSLVMILIQTLRNLRRTEDRILRTGALTAMLFTVLVFCSGFWKIFGRYCEFIQFPGRLLGPAVAGAVLMFCLWIGGRERNGRMAQVLLVLILLIFAWQVVGHRADYGEPVTLGEGLLTERIAGLGAGEEWLPDGANRDAMTEPEKSYDPTGGGADGTKHDYGKYYEVYVPMQWKYYDVPYLYYKGYQAYLLNEDGEPAEQLKTGKADGGGYVRIYLPDGREGIGHIMVTYRKTLLQKISYSINGAAVLILFLWICKSSFELRPFGRKY